MDVIIFTNELFYTQKYISGSRPTNISLSFIKDVEDGSFWFLTIEAAETFLYGLLTTRGTCFLKKYWGDRPLKNHILQGFDHQICIFKDILKSSKITLFKKSSSDSTPSALLIWLKKIST